MKKILTLFVIFLSLTVFSQTDTTKVKDIFDMTLEELMQLEVVTASKTSQKITDAPANVVVINRRQIVELNYSCLSDLLDDVQQIEIQRKTNIQTSDVFIINGIEGNERIIILVDGKRFNSTTGTYHTIG